MLQKSSNYFLKKCYLLALAIFPMYLNAQIHHERLQPKIPAEIDSCLKLAGDNLGELTKAINCFSSEGDSLKLSALYFLINDLNDHTCFNKTFSYNNAIANIVSFADSLYYNQAKNKSVTELKSKNFIDSLKQLSLILKPKIEHLNFVSESDHSNENSGSALENISAKFLIDQINHAFYLKSNSELVKKLSFNEFCESILSFQSSVDRNIRVTNKELNQFFNKYIPRPTVNLTESVEFLNTTLKNFKVILGKYPLSYKNGFEEILFSSAPSSDCFDYSNFESAILRSVGIPIYVYNNVGYKMLRGRHSSCTIPENIGSYTMFSLDSETPVPILKTKNENDYNGSMNLYRNAYAKNMESPSLMKGAFETVPHFFENPHIVDVSYTQFDTQELEIPISSNTTNKIAYLGTHDSATGLYAVTWGLINKEDGKVVFKNVIPNRLYFPILYENESYKEFSKPFFLTSTGKLSFDRKGKKVRNVAILSKFPRKPNMLRVAENLKGTIVTASNGGTTKIDTLKILDINLKPYLQDIELKNQKPYKRYFIQAPKENPKFQISEIYFLTKKEFAIVPSKRPPLLPILSTKQKIDSTSLVEVIAESWTTKNNAKVQDGKMTTDLGGYGGINMSYSQPAVITHLRIAPLNEDNGVQPGHEYRLSTWQNGQWEDVWTGIVQFNYIPCKKLLTNRLYWLSDITAGKEESPFTINKEGNQQFLY